MGGRRFFPFLIALLIFALFSSCSQTTSSDPQLEKMDTTINALSKALREPGLYELLKSIEDKEYTTSNALDILFSAYGSGFWPPPGANLHPSEAANLGEEHVVELLPVVRDNPTGPWQVVVTAQEKRFLVRGYGESQEQPLRQETVDFPAR